MPYHNNHSVVHKAARLILAMLALFNSAAMAADTTPDTLDAWSRLGGRRY